MIRVLIVDDSAFMRRLLVKLIEPHEDIDVVATAMDGVFALDKIQKLESSRPDVVTLDLEMPRLDGMSTLRRIVDEFQLPVILVSAHTSKGATATFEGLAAGAVDFVTKPDRIFSSPMGSLASDLVAKIRVAAKAKLRRPRPRRAAEPTRKTRRASSSSGTLARGVQARRDVVGIAISTGGPNALSQLMAQIRGDFSPSLLIVQHMPEGFTEQFATRLAKLSAIDVHEAREGEVVSSRYNSSSLERSRLRNTSKSSDRHCVTRLTTDFDTPVPLRTSANVASMSRVDIPCTYIRAISSSSFSVRLTYASRIFERKPVDVSRICGTWTVTAPSPVRTRCDSYPLRRPFSFVVSGAFS